MKQFPILHIQRTPEKSREILEYILGAKKPVGVSCVPALSDKRIRTEKGIVYRRVYPEENYYTHWAKELIYGARYNSDIIKFQEGDLHFCEGCFEQYEKNGGRKNKGWPDPWHEGEWYCKHNKNKEKIKKIMLSGKITLGDLFGESEGYCPPQHYSTKKSRKIAEQIGYKYFLVKNMTNLKSWKEGNMTIIPVAKIGEKYSKVSPAVFAYLDRLADNPQHLEKFYSVLENSVHPDELEISNKPTIKMCLNHLSIHSAKKLRDKK